MDPRPVNPGPQRSPDDDTPRPDAAAPNQCKPGELGPVPTGWSHASSPEAAEATEMGHEPALESNDEDDATFRDASRGPRLQKVLSAAGVGSRRACETLIEDGKVMVNDVIIRTLPAWVHPTKDRIEVDGRRIHGPVAPVNVMLYKPRGVVCTNDDPEGRRQAIDLVQHPTRARLFTVGRLDIDSSGLLLLTNDGTLAQRLVHPSHNIEKVYEVLVRGYLSDESVRILLSGVFLIDREGDKPRRSKVKHIDITMRDKQRTRFQAVLGEGRNRQIRRMTAAIGHPVKRLKRLSIGPLKLRGLQPGQWRNLDRNELRSLRRAAHLPK